MRQSIQTAEARAVPGAPLRGRRRRALVAGIAAACLAACAHAVQAQSRAAEYPAKPVTVVVGFSAGSTNDAAARVISARLSESLGQQFIIVNREGAAGAVSGAYVAKSKPDGYTLLWASSATMVTGPAYHGNTAYDPLSDFVPIGVFCYLPYVIIVHPTLPARNVRELIELARREPDKIAYASTGVGGTLHLAMELLQHMGKVRMTHVPYKGTPTVIVDLLSGQVQLGIMSANLVMPHVKTGRMRAIAVSGGQRSALLPDVPTVAESGLKGYDVSGFYGLVAPARTSPAIITTVHKAFVQGLEHPEVKAMIGREGARAGGEQPEQFAQFLRTETTVYKKLIADANLRKQSR